MFGFLFKKKFKLDEPLTLLDQYYVDVYDKILTKSPYCISEEGDGYLEYYNGDDADWEKEFSGLFDINVMNFVKYIENEKYDNAIYAAGKIYSDKDEKYIDSLISKLTRFLTPVTTSKGSFIEDWYWYNDKIQMCVEKDYINRPNHEYWRVIVTYRLLEPTPSKFYLKEKKKQKKDSRNRIESDIKKCLK